MQSEISGQTKLTLLLVSSLTIMSIITISPALPLVSEHFDAVPNVDFLTKLMLTIPALFIALVAPLAGVLIDRFGRLRILHISILMYALTGSAGYYLTDLAHIIISRALLGISVGVSMTVVVTLVADYFEGVARQKFAGLQVAFMSIGGILFIGLGGVLADIHWRSPFLIYLFALLVLPLSMLWLTEPNAGKKEEGSKSGIQVPGFIWLLFINTMLMWVVFFLIPVQLPFFLEDLGVDSKTLIGIAIASSTFFSALSSFSYARFRGRLSFERIFVIGYLLMGLAFAIISQAESYGLVILSMALGGLGMGIMIPNTNIWVMQLAPQAVRGREIGKLTTFWFLGQFLSPIITFPLVAMGSISTTFLFAAVFLVFLGFLFFVADMRSNQNAS